MKASDLPTLRDFFQANKPTWKKYGSTLIFWVIFTVAIWIVEGLFNLRISRAIPILGGLSIHYIPEWTTFFVLGCFEAEIKKTVIPKNLIFIATYLGSVFFGLWIVGFSFRFTSMLLFVSPFLIGYLFTRIKDVKN